jgi:hypothetical protein
VAFGVRGKHVKTRGAEPPIAEWGRGELVVGPARADADRQICVAWYE